MKSQRRPALPEKTLEFHPWTSLAACIDFLTRFTRLVWEETTTQRPIQGCEITRTKFSVPEELGRVWLRDAGAEEVGGEENCRRFLERNDLLTEAGDVLHLEPWLRQLGVVIDKLFPSEGVALRADARYFVYRAIRRHYRLGLTPETARLFHLLAASLPIWANDEGMSYAALREALREWAGWREEGDEAIRSVADGFLEMCVYQRIVKPDANDPWRVALPEDQQDGEYLLSQLFGLPMTVRGLDNLFGGGGPLLGDTWIDELGSSEEESEDDSCRQSGRIQLLNGRYGTGKTTLAMSIAASVARKGGLVYVMLLEQSVRDCSYQFETLGLLGEINRPRLCTTVAEWQRELERPGDGNQGIICLLSHRSASITARLQSIVNMEKITRDKWPLRLVVLDPVNAMIEDSAPHGEKGRAFLAEVFGALKDKSMNLILASEDNSSAIVQNIQSTADTVIELTTRSQQGYEQRFIEIRKNRYQREQRGQHPLSIKPGEGIVIFPSPASIAATERDRGNLAPGVAVNFGCSGLDKVLGPGSIHTGDVVVFTGPSGTSKTDLGLVFALGANHPPKRNGNGVRGPTNARTLIISLRESWRGVRRLVTAPRYRDLKMPKGIEELVIRDNLATGYVQPGRIMQAVSEAFEAASPLCEIDRVFVDDVALWDLNCPFVKAEVTFIQTFIQFLRNRGVVTLFCLPAERTREDVVQTSILGAADVHVDFRMLDYRGSRQPVFNVIKSRSLKARRGMFDVRCTDEKITIGKQSTQVRLSAAGEVSVISSILILHAEEDGGAQQQYNLYLQTSLRQLFGESITVESRDCTVGMTLARLQAFATVDCLQILQVDDFQLDELISGPTPSVKSYAQTDVDMALGKPITDSWWAGDRDRLIDRNRVYGFPYLNNRARLMFDGAALTAAGFDPVRVGSWVELAEGCKEYEKDAEALFFAFDNQVSETYNVLFLEIFLGLGGKVPTTKKELLKWHVVKEFRQALEILVTLCARFVQWDKAGKLLTKDGALLKRPCVWRSWFTSLECGWIGKVMSGNAHVTSVPLPGGGNVSGDWYLVVPLVSTSHGLALDIVKEMTDRDQQLVRFERSVGLPSCPAFFGSRTASDSSSSVDQSYRDSANGETGSLRRASIPCYKQFHGVLAKHLRDAVLRGPVFPDAVLGEAIELIRGDIAFAVENE